MSASFATGQETMSLADSFALEGSIHMPSWQGDGIVKQASNKHHCTCGECGTEFSVQRAGALYLCERCAASDL